MLQPWTRQTYKKELKVYIEPTLGIAFLLLAGSEFHDSEVNVERVEDLIRRKHSYARISNTALSLVDFKNKSYLKKKFSGVIFQLFERSLKIERVKVDQWKKTKTKKRRI